MQDKSAKWQEFENKLLKLFKHRSKIARRQGLEAFRIFDNELPSFPFVIELYGDRLYVAEYKRNHQMEETEHMLWLEECLRSIGHVLDMDQEYIFLRERKKMSHREDQYERLGLQKDFFTIKENELNFWINLTDYLDSGLFLDHRMTRKMVYELSCDKRVLNLFSYTGSFSVYAASAGASAVTSVDLSKTYLKWSEDNFSANNLHLDNKKYQFVHADVKQYLKELSPASYDIIVMDPPTFSNSKRMKDILDIQRDHVELINDALRVLAQDGILFFSTNYTKFELAADMISASEIKDITKATTPFDFEGKLKRWCYRIKK